MKRKLKSLVSLAVCMVMLFSCVFAVNGRFVNFSASADEEVTEIPAEPEQPSEDTEEPAEPEDSSEYVAELYLCSCGAPCRAFVFGHCWVCIKNISDETLYIGEQAIESGETVTAGLHPGGGLRFGVESERFSGRSVRSLEYNLTSEDFQNMTDEMLKSKWTWYELFTHNCSNFASKVWNAATGDNIVAFCFPFVVSMQMIGAEKITID